MRDIPVSLLAKIKQSYQTIHGNAEPRMDIFVGGEGDYLTALERFFVFTIQDGQTLNRIDAASQRPDPNLLPTHVTIVYLVDDDAYVAKAPLPIGPKTEWTIVGALGKGLDVSIEFEGYWTRRIKSLEQFDDPRTSRWSLVTVGEPWYFVTRLDGSVEARQGLTGDWTTIVASGVTRIDALAGWKGLLSPEDDQGLVLGFVRNGEVWYRNRAEQVGGSIIWEVEKEVTDLPSNCVNVSLFRTNDYRMGFIAETDDIPAQIHWVLTERCWSGMAIDDHYTEGGWHSAEILVTYVTYEEAYQEPHYVEGLAGPAVIGVCDAATPAQAVTGPEVPLGINTITLDFNSPLIGELSGLQGAFTAQAANAVWLTVLSTAAGTSQSQLLLYFSTLEGIQGPVTVVYSARPWILMDRGGACIQKLAGFSCAVLLEGYKGYHDEYVEGKFYGGEITVTEANYVSGHMGEAEHNATARWYSASIVVTAVEEEDP